jgi:cytoskeletal protein CcmA (bactofilin family)
MEPSKPSWTSRILQRNEPEPELAEPMAEPVPAGPPVAVIDSGCSIDGRLTMDRPIRVEGDLRGRVESSDTVVVAEGGTVEGDIQARSIIIQGAVVGNVNGRREVVIEPTGKLHGDVETACFEMARGAYFNGHTKMLRPQDTGWRKVDSPASD